MVSRPSDLIRGALTGAGTASSDLFFVEHGGGLFRISRAELLKGLVQTGLVAAAGGATQLQLYNDGVGAINGFGTSSARFDIRSVGEFDFYSGTGPTKVAQLGTAGLLLPPLNMSKGSVVLTPGDAVQAGYVGFFKPGAPNSQRIGYIGYNPAALAIVSDSPYPVIINSEFVGINGTPARAFEVIGASSGYVGSRVANGSTGLSAGAEMMIDLSSVGNAFFSAGINRNGGNPYVNLYSGTAITTTYIDTPGKLQFNVGAAGQVAIVVGRIFPVADNGVANGGPSNRWTQVFAVTGTINTSSREAKRNIVYLSPDNLVELRAANLLRVGARLARQVTSFQWADAVAEKGEENARKHIGWIFDDCVAAFQAEGFDPWKEGAVCRDPKTRQIVEEVDGQEMPATEDVEVEVEEVVVGVDGKGRVRRETRIEKRPLFREIPLVDDEGNPIMREVRRDPRLIRDQSTGEMRTLLDSEGHPITDPVLAPAVHRQQIMQPGPKQKIARTEPVEGEYVEALRIDYIQSLCIAALAAGVTIAPEE